MKSTPPPYDPDRRDALVDKWGDRSLSPDEAEELLEYLESDLEAVETEEEERVLTKAVAFLRVQARAKLHSA